jgi:transcriptional regulator with XRE-family HTH domain
VTTRLSERFGACIRELRAEAGLTQIEFAERCGFSQTYLSRLENGNANPSLNAIEVLGGGLSLDVFQLFERVKLMGVKSRR